MEFLTLRSLEPIPQFSAGIEYPLQGILLGLEREPTLETACLIVKEPFMHPIMP